MVLEASLDGLDEGVQIVSPEWRYLYVNLAAARQGRAVRESLLGRTMMECYPRIDTTSMFETLRRCMQDRVPATLENEFTYEDGRRASFDLRVRPCDAGIVILSLDMTERKDVEKRLAASYQQALRDLIHPIIRVHRGVLLVPLVGAIDAQRAAAMTEKLLTRIVDDGARVVILDVAGVPVMDTAVAGDLLQTTAMIRLLGARTVMTGLTAEAAKAIVELGIDLSAIETRTQLAEGIDLALSTLGLQIVPASA